MILNPDSTITVKDTILVDKTIKLDSILSAAYQNPDIQAAYQQIQINQYLEKEVGAYDIRQHLPTWDIISVILRTLRDSIF